jgi:hypothetical protein
MNENRTTDKEFVGIAGDLINVTKALYEYGIGRGLMTPEDMRLTIAKRQERAKELVDAGMSIRDAGEVLGISHTQVRADIKKLEGNLPENGKKSSSNSRGRPRLNTENDGDPIEEECGDCNSNEERWHRSLGNLAGDAISLEAYWTRQFGEDWQRFAVPDDLVTLAQNAAQAWANVAKQLKGRSRKGKG